VKKIEYIDFAKGYAIFTIVIYHIMQRVEMTPLLKQAIGFGGTGVHLFFLLSGFGLGLSKNNFSPADFYQRRASKIWLPYVLVLIISLLAAYTMRIFADDWMSFMAGTFLYQMFFEQYIESFGGHFWFISAIIQFYIAFPLLLWLKQKLEKTAGAFLLLCFATSILWWLLVFYLGKGALRTWNSFFLQFLWEFALGMELAQAYRNKTKVWSILNGNFWDYRWWVYLPIGLIFTTIMAGMILKMGPIGKIFNDIPALLGYTALSIFLFKLGELFLPPIKQFFLWISTFSYSLYLVHILGLELYLLALKTIGISLNLPILILYIPLALLLGRLFEPVSQYWVERIIKI
jgi:peptidoglycan/LPS O-acetylase OafA/YrhL